MIDILSNIGIGVGSFGAAFVLIQYRMTQQEKKSEHIEQELEKQIQAINISKSGRLKELKEDYNDKIQVLHDRVDRIRDHSNKQFDEIKKDMLDRNDKLQERMDSNFKSMSEKIDSLKDLIIQMKK